MGRLTKYLEMSSVDSLGRVVSLTTICHVAIEATAHYTRHNSNAS